MNVEQKSGQPEQEDVSLLVLHVAKMLHSQRAPDLPERFAGNDDITVLHDMLLNFRRIVQDFSKGHISSEIQLRGFCAGCLKALQAHLLHLIWQVQMVESGDYSQRIEFLGDFSLHFNKMTERLNATINKLNKKDEEMRALTGELEQEVELRKAVMNALSTSEAKFRYLAEHDPLTNCLNRRSFLLNAVDKLQAAVTRQVPCCVALLDIDFFKKVNDTHGHLEGDMALRHVVQVARKALRSGDLLGRYGGEEFVFFFFSASKNEGTLAATRICNILRESPMILQSGEELQLTVSLGVAEILPAWPGERDCSYMEAIIKRADTSLYAAKRNGRDRVEVAESIPTEINES